MYRHAATVMVAILAVGGAASGETFGVPDDFLVYIDGNQVLGEIVVSHDASGVYVDGFETFNVTDGQSDEEMFDRWRKHYAHKSYFIGKDVTLENCREAISEFEDTKRRHIVSVLALIRRGLDADVATETVEREAEVLITGLKPTILADEVDIAEGNAWFRDSCVDGGCAADPYPFNWQGWGPSATVSTVYESLIRDLRQWLTYRGQPVALFVDRGSVACAIVGSRGVTDVRSEIDRYRKTGIVGKLVNKRLLEGIVSGGIRE